MPIRYLSERQKRPLGRPRRWYVDNIKMDLRETGWAITDWTDLAKNWDRGGLL
jgi:hypothetical protein